MVSSKFFLLSLVFSAVFTFSYAAYIQPLTRTPLRPFSVNQNYTTDYSFSFSIPSTIPFNAYIEVEFPIIYELPSACEPYLKAQDEAFQLYPCVKKTPSTYQIDIGHLVSGNYVLVLVGIKNPASHSASSNLKLRTYFGEGNLVDSNEHFDAVPLLSSPCKKKRDLSYKFFDSNLK